MRKKKERNKPLKKKKKETSKPLTKREKADNLKRYLSFNTKYRDFANQEGVTIYATCIGGTRVGLWKQKGENFLRLNDKTYDQNKFEDVVEYVAEIDRAYERYYKKFKK